MLSIARGVAEGERRFGRRDNRIFTPPSTDILWLKIFREDMAVKTALRGPFCCASL